MYDLVIPVWQADVVDAARRLAERRHRQARFAGEQGAVTLPYRGARPTLPPIIAGAGHVAVPLAAMATLCDSPSPCSTIGRGMPTHSASAADRAIAGPFRDEVAQLRGDRPAFDPAHPSGARHAPSA